MRALAGLLLLLVLMASGPTRAAVGPPIAGSPGLLCRAAIAGAEQGQAIPPHLLAAIGRVESGRRDAVTGAWHPWPWTVNAEGQGLFFDSKAQAVAAVRDMRARGVRSIDVGCTQVNLMHHQDAFPGLEQAFDPAANAAYAARFLRQLFVQTGAWPKAVALYHSATPALGEPYSSQVMAVWLEEARHPMPAGTALANAWGATTGHGGFPPVRRTIGAGGSVPASGAAPLARGLDVYRSQPIGFGRSTVGRIIRPDPFAGRFHG